MIPDTIIAYLPEPNAALTVSAVLWIAKSSNTVEEFASKIVYANRVTVLEHENLQALKLGNEVLSYPKYNYIFVYEPTLDTFIVGLPPLLKAIGDNPELTIEGFRKWIDGIIPAYLEDARTKWALHR